MNVLDEILNDVREVKEKLATISTATPTQQPEIIDSKELCRRLAISEPTLISWRKKKKIPCFHIGNSIRYNWPTVIDFLEKQKK